MIRLISLLIRLTREYFVYTANQQHRKPRTEKTQSQNLLARPQLEYLAVARLTTPAKYVLVGSSVLDCLLMAHRCRLGLHQ